ncbi:NHS-like protein 3 isoform X2 [Oncorhynchus clarkii lewisi]|uniref:NHS-like protein 3 isoform X2 n=1 Tax=Oncorhynchus clarkii lewisi TaxID=490388 RepID=UPI0039B98AE2
MVVYLRKNIRSLLSVFKKKAGPKCLDEQKKLTVHYTASSHYQENVFIEGNRPQYLEDLHTEAQEGLKILQQEEHNKGVDFQEDHSDADVSPNHGDGSQESGSTAGNSVTAVTSAGLAVSTRPVLTRQGSTFKPLNPVKRQDKRKNRRTTIMGIPQQVQRELALHSGSEYKVHSQLPNGSVGQGSDSQSGAVVIPTIDGETPLASYEGARVHLSDLEASREEQLLRHHLQSVYRDDQGFSHHRGLDSRLSSTQRPKSLAVPGTTSSCSSGFPSFLQEQGPVMSISPQATYMSKIIPNAYLPASVDVIQIDRSTSRTRGNSGNGTARTISKSCLASGSSDSPASSRRSGGEGCYEGGDSVSHGDSSSRDNGSKVTPHSVTSWSHSQSSETIKSNSSAISSTKGSFGLANPQTVSLVGQETQPQQPGAGDQDKVSLQSSSALSSTSRGTGTATAQGVLSGSGGMSDVGGDSFRFSRCLSIMKSKLPPAPPRRTNSLHHEKMIKRRLVEIKDLSDSAGGKLEAAEDTSLVTIEISKELYKEITKSSVPVSKSSGFNSLDDTRSSTASSPLSPTQASHGGSGKSEGPVSSSSSPQKAPSEEGTFERTMSPSSGYSSQSGTPTLSPKGILPSVSPGKQKKYPVKPERSGSRASFSAASVSSSLTSLSSVTSELVNREASKNSFSPLQQASLPLAVMRIEDPETGTPVRFSSSMVISELLNIPPPPKIKAPSPPPPETWAHNRHTFELLCGPCPNINRLAQLQEQQELKEQAAMIEQKQEPQTKASKESEGSNKKQATVEEVTLTKSESKHIVPRDKTEPMLEQAPEVSESTESQTKEQGSLAVIAEKVKASVEIQDQKQEQSSSSSSSVAQVKDQEERLETQVSLTMIPKKEPPPVMKKSTPRKEAKVQLTADIQQKSPFDEVTVEVKVESPSKSEKCSPRDEVVAKEVEVVTKKVEVEVAAKEVEGRSATENTKEESPTKSTQTLAVEPPKVDRVSPPASPPPSHHPPPPPSKTPPYSVATPPPELEEECEEEIPIVQSCWPPPPPPEEPADSVFDEPDEMDFPPPPPPFMTESLADVVETCNTVADVQEASIIALDGEEVKETVNGFTVATVNGETTDLSTISTQMEPKEDKPEKVILNSNALIPTDETSFEESESAELQLIPSDDSAVISPVQPNEKEAEVKQSAQKPITMQEDTPQPTETSPESQEVPPLPEDVPPPHQEAPPPPPPMTTALVPPSSIPPPPPPINVPLPPRVQCEDQMPSVLPNNAPRPPPINIPLPPPLPTENQPPVIFRRQPSLANRETRSKELLSRHKSVPIPKEDANIPLVTPSLLQMVRLRSVNVGEDYVKALSDDNNSNSGMPPAQNQSSTQIQTQGSQNITPQKPIRRSLSLKSTPPPLKSSPVTLIAPSMSMQEAIRMKTAAMSSRDNLPTRFRMPSSISIPSCSGAKSGMLSPLLPEGGEMLKTPTTTTASFIFSRSSKKVVIETPASSSPEVQASLKQSLAAELKRFSEQSMASTVANGNVGRTGIPRRIPPPVAKKPAHTLEKPVCSTLRSTPSPRGTEANGETETAQPAGQQALTEDSK